MSKGPERASNQSDTCGCGITVMTVLTDHLIEKLTRHHPRLVLPAFLFVLRHIEFVLEFFIKPARSAAAAKEFRIQRVDLLNLRGRVLSSIKTDEYLDTAIAFKRR